MSYGGALRRLLDLHRFGVQPGLEAIQRALDQLGNPERAFPGIHITGSNGKGSTAAMCEAVLREAGLRVGLYTSPHLARFTERIRIDGREIEAERIAPLVDRVLEVAPTLTFFEAATAVGFLAFADASLDIAVIEVGLGGRLDATNVITRPLVSVVTSIALEHTEVLGNTLSAIAYEKAGIFRANVPAVAAARDDEARDTITAVAQRVGAPLAWLGTDFQAAFETALLGAHQRDNAALAVAALQRLPDVLRPPENAFSALTRVSWPGRLEKIDEDLVLDGAHNEAGALALAAALPALAKDRPVTLLLGMVDDKDVGAFLTPLFPQLTYLITTWPDTPRARTAEALRALALRDGPALANPVEAISDPVAAIARARKNPGLVVVTGSLFLIGQLRAHLRGEQRDPVVAQDPKATRSHEPV